MNASPYAQVVMNEIVALAGDPGLTLEQLGRNMESLADRANILQDQQALALVDVAWNGIVTLSEQAGQAFSVAVAAKTVAEQLQVQRDEALREHGELVQAIDDMDVDNVKIAGLIEQAEEMFEENLMGSGAYVTACPACDICAEYNGMIPVSHEVAEMFHDLITGAMYDELGEDEDEIYAEIAAFMNRIVDRVK